MRISDWSSDVCSSDLIHAAKVHERKARVGDIFIGEPRQQLARLRPGNDETHHVAAARVQRHAFFRQVLLEPAQVIVLGDAGAEDEEALRPRLGDGEVADDLRSEEHTSELQSLMRISYAVFCLKKKKKKKN